MKKLKILSVLGAALLLAGFSGLAVCPPGAERVSTWADLVDQAEIEGNNICIDTSFESDAGAVVEVAHNVAIAAEHDGITLTIQDDSWFDVQGRNVTIHNVRIVVEDAPAQVIQINNDNATIADVTIIVEKPDDDEEPDDDEDSVDNVIDVQSGMDHTITGNFIETEGTNAINVQGGINTTITDNDIRLVNGADGSAITITSGIGHLVRRNWIKADTGSVNFGGDDGGLIYATVTAIKIEDNTIEAAEYFENVNENVGLIHVTGAGSQVHNNQIDVTGRISDFASGIIVRGSNSEVTRNRVTMGDDGLVGVLLDASGVTLLDNNITRPQFIGVAITPSGVNAVLERNTLSGAGAIGVIVLASNGQIVDNSINGSGAFGVMLFTSNNQVRDNTIDGTSSFNGLAGDGVLFGHSGAASNTIEGNRISNSARHGVNFLDIEELREIAEQTGLWEEKPDDNDFGDFGAGQPVWGPDLRVADAPNNVIRNNTIANSGASGVNVPTAAVNTEIVGNTIERSRGDSVVFLEPEAGICITGGAGNALIEGNRVTGGSSFGIIVHHVIVDDWGDGDGAGEWQVRDPGDDAINAQILDNTVERNRATGIYVRGQLNALIEGNTLHNNGSDVFGFGEGIALDRGANTSVIRGNVVTSDLDLTVENRGIRVSGSDNVVVEDNLVSNTGTLEYGLIVDVGTTMVDVRNNEIVGMGEVGLVVTGGSFVGKATVTGNVLTNNVIGIEFRGGRADVTDGNVITEGVKGLHVIRGRNAAFYEVTGNDITSPVRARNRGTGTLDATNNWWGHEDGPPANTIFGNVDYDPWATEPFVLEPDPVEPDPEIDHTFGAAEGWYMVSVPTTGDTADIFGVTMYRYDPDAGEYVTADTLEPGKGYWARMPANQEVVATGSIPTYNVEVSLGSTGWHQISAPWQYSKGAIRVLKAGDNKSWSEAVDAGWIRDTIFAYEATVGDYTTPTTLRPWYGYWMRALESGVTLRFNYAARAAETGVALSTGPAPVALSVPSDLPSMPNVAELAADNLTVSATPNPLREGTATFRVAGPLAADTQEIKVQVLDVSGRSVFTGSAIGSQLTWDVEGIANGVYLYRVEAKLAGQWVTSSYQKLLIVR